MPVNVPRPPATPGLMLGSSSYTPGDLVWRSPGATNLLTSDVASAETTAGTWFCAVNGTVARSTAQALVGSASVSLTATADAAITIATTPNTSIATTAHKVTPGRLYTGLASTRAATNARANAPIIAWYDAAGTQIGNTIGATVTNSTSGWTPLIATGYAPATAALARLQVQFLSCLTGDAFYIDCASFHEGAGGTWAMPGDPIQGIGTYWDESVGRRCFAWNPVQAGWQMVYGDTGWRDVSSLLVNSWTGAVYLRRLGFTTQLRVENLVSGSATTIATLPAGFRPDRAEYLSGWHTVDAHRLDLATSGVLSSPQENNLYGTFQFATTTAWPTTLPGVASGSIPTA